jgi:hypothetical protein
MTLSMEQALDYLLRLEPALGGRGARTEDVDELEALAGLPLPAAYRRFLLAVGEAPSFRVEDECDMRLPALLDIYRRLPGTVDSYIPAGGLLVGVGGLSDLALDLRAPGEPALWLVMQGSYQRRAADSLAHAVFREAFLRARVKGRAQSMESKQDVDLSAALASAALAGFVPLPGSDCVAACLERADGTALLLEARGRTLFVIAAGRDEAAARSAAAAIR